MATRPPNSTLYSDVASFMTSPVRAPIWVTWSILSIWLLFGCLAFTEQLSLLTETSSLDEEVLAELAFSIKPDAPMLVLPLSNSASAIVVDHPVHFHTASPSFTTPSHSTTQSPLRLYQRLSVYRL